MSTTSTTSTTKRAWYSPELHGVDHIPETERHGRSFDLLPLWFGLNAALFTVITGAIAGTVGLSFGWAATGLVIGAVLGAIPMAYHSAQGPKLGISQMIQSRAQFGFVGAILPFVMALLIQLGFLAATISLGAIALADFVPVSPQVGAVLIAALSLVFVIFGYRWIHSYARVMVWAFGIVFAIITALLVFGHPLSGANYQALNGSFQFGPFMLAVALSFIYVASYAPYCSDYSRYLPRNSSVAGTFIWTALGVGITSAWLMPLGAYVDIIANHPADINLAFGSISQSVGGWFRDVMFIVVVLSMGIQSTLNLYSSFLSMGSIYASVGRVKPSLSLRLSIIAPVFVIGTVGAFLFLANYLNTFELFLTLVLYAMIPWSAINLADFYFVRKGRYSIGQMFEPNGIYGRVNLVGWGAYIIGLLVEAPFANVPGVYTGPVAKLLQGGDISYFVAFPVIMVVYVAWARTRPPVEPADAST